MRQYTKNSLITHLLQLPKKYDEISQKILKKQKKNQKEIRPKPEGRNCVIHR